MRARSSLDGFKFKRIVDPKGRRERGFKFSDYSVGNLNPRCGRNPTDLVKLSAT